MKKLFLFLMAHVVATGVSFGQGKIIIGIMPFKSSAEQGGNYNNRRQNQSQQTTAIEDAVTNVFVQTKRFSLVERQKMDQIKSEKNLQKNVRNNCSKSEASGKEKHTSSLILKKECIQLS